jgi:hypothetical protein
MKTLPAIPLGLHSLAAYNTKISSFTAAYLAIDTALSQCKLLNITNAKQSRYVYLYCLFASMLYHIR